ncbi:ParA family protein [Photobacterium damselae]
MKVILSTFNKGGVGKTTLAVHLAGALAEDPFQRVLLVDCVDQYDSVSFLSGTSPDRKLKTLNTKYPNVSVVWNPERESLKKVIGQGQYDSVILDLNSPAKDTVKAIVNAQPTGVFLPINRQALALGRLKDTLALIAAMADYTGYIIPVVIVPLGSDLMSVESALKDCRDCIGSMSVNISRPVAFDPIHFENALINGKFVWEYQGCEYVKPLLQDALGRI